MRHRPAGALDLGTGALIVSGAVLIALSVVAAIVLLTPAGGMPSAPTAAEPGPTPVVAGRMSVVLPADRVAAILNVDASTGAGVAARSGDHVDVLGYFSKEVTGGESVTRVLLRDVPVMTVDRSAANVALTLAVPQDASLLLQEAQALGARPFVMLLPDIADTSASVGPRSFSDTDLANRLTSTR